MSTDTKHGTRVRVTLEGTTSSHIDDSNPGVYLYTGKGQAVFLPDDAGVEVEVLDPPKPEWWPLKNGDVVLVAITPYFIDWDGKARHLSNGEEASFADSFGDWLTEWANDRGWHRVKLLVRDQQAVAG